MGWYPENVNPPQFVVIGEAQHGGNIRATDSIDFLSSDTLELETILAKGSVWRYEDSGTGLGTDWRSVEFDDGAWSSGPAKLAYGESDVVHPVAQYGCQSAGDSRPE